MSRTAPETAAERVLEVRDLRVSYGAIEALKGVSLTLDQGEIVTLIGANGAGKSTTLRSIMGLVPASGGEILFHGRSTAEGVRNSVKRAVEFCSHDVLGKIRSQMELIHRQEEAMMGNTSAGSEK